MKSISEIIDLIKEVEAVEEDASVARLLQIEKSVLANWRKRGTIPYRVLFNYCERNGMSLHWLLTGSGSKYLKSQDKNQLVKRLTELEKKNAELRSVLRRIKENLAEAKTRGRSPQEN